MSRTRWSRLLVCTLAILVLGCAAPGQPASPSSSQSAGVPSDSGPVRAAGPKRIVAATRGDPHTLIAKINAAGSSQAQGVSDLQDLVTGGLTNPGERGDPRAQLAEAVPSVENGLWKVFPDGRMDTTWRIRTGARWHDGTPITSDDLLFTATVGRDKDVPLFGDIGYTYLESIEAPDAQTVTVHWARPFIDADTMFSSSFALPLPKHLLEEPYSTSKASLAQHPYWSRDFVGSGPYRIQEWELDSHLLLRANDDYVLGRPHVGEILIRFITDANTLVANVLAGEVELTLGRGLSLEQAMEARNEWRAGQVDFRISGGLIIYPQFINPTPAVAGDVLFRRALVHAIDRQAMADGLTGGLTSAADIFLSPDYPGYDAVAGGIVKYPHDPARALQIVEGLGYTRGGDGALRDAAGQRLALELRVSEGDDLNRKAMLAVADSWQRLGLSVDPVVIPPQRATDREYAATFPAFFLNRQKSDLTNMANFHGSKTPLPETSFVGVNRSRYMNPAFDALLDRYFTTIPRAERLDVVRQIVNHITDRVTMVSLFYSEDATLIGNRLQHVSSRYTNAAWNANEWDLSG